MRGDDGGIHIVAAGGIAAGAMPVADAAAAQAVLAQDAPPVPLRALVAGAAPRVSRLASRFAQLAALGAADCLARHDRALAPDTRVYLGSGLGDVAQTDALYHEVMPPRSEAAQPARFATSGNNMAAFFVAQHAGLAARNLTLAQGDLSFEGALELALSDLAAGACRAALVGGVDETTLPRAHYARRYPLADGDVIGEGSGWLLLEAVTGDPAGASRLETRILPRAAGHEDDASWARRIGDALAAMAADRLHGASLCLLRGGALAQDAFALLQRRLGCDQADYLRWAGRFPTAAAVGIAGLLAAPGVGSARRWFAHVNRDGSGRTGVTLFRIGEDGPWAALASEEGLA